MNLSLPEIWGGIECTINRIGDSYFDQLDYSGHYHRKEDIDLFASLGIKALRYPVLWEHHEIEKGKEINWADTSERLEKIRANGIIPIAGLLHHGSGPAFTNLLDENFAEDLSEYARKVAEKFPWLEYYTPVNEPLTTARFSGLYGLWYPHHKNDISFVRMLLNQLKGIVLSMKAIRSVNPTAKLVQTEDLGKTFSTAALSFQASFENERRWLTWDILCGRLLPGTIMYEHFLRLGIPETQLQFFIDNPCPPAIMGINYYITSERFLDENLSGHPAYSHGGNELQEYADVEAIQVNHGQSWGLKMRLFEAWDRFRLPIAVTESHINCSREEQLRWFYDSWNSLCELKLNGIDVRALTAWSLLGSFGWDKLLTDASMNYESGVFDLRSGMPRPTALAAVIKSAANRIKSFHPLSYQAGWWKRRYTENIVLSNPAKKIVDRPVLIFGKTGTLGRAFAKVCIDRHIPFYIAGREDADITNYGQLQTLLQKINPWAVINAAGYVKIDEAEIKPADCYAANTAAPVLIATLCAASKIQFMTFSSDQVFDGYLDRPYNESDLINPLNVYGHSKALAEVQVQYLNPDALIIRTSAFFGPWDNANFATAVIASLSAKKRFKAVDDVVISPTYVPDLVNYTLSMLIDNEKGTWHISNGQATSWASFAKSIALRAGLDAHFVQAVPAEKLNWKANRPMYATLISAKGASLPSLNNAIERFIADGNFNHEKISAFATQ